MSDEFALVPGSDVVGEMQVIRARYEDTFIDIARAYDLGFDELVQANPGVDPWLPGAGTPIVLPTQFILPDAPRDGIVLNIGTKRIFFYPKAAAGESPRVITHPVGIGREGWGTPIGTTRVVSKVKDPVWTVPPSIRREHAEAGDPLPARVPAGPDNPLGAYALRLGFPSYLIHGTNKPSGIGMRVSHGCVQLFPEDIETLFSQVPVGTPVRIVNQPQLLGWRDGNLYREAPPALEDDRRNLRAALDRQLAQALRRRQAVQAAGAASGLDAGLVAATLKEGRGFPVRLLESAADAGTVAARARPTINIVTYPAERDAAAGAAPGPALDAANR
ncbi:MAG: L,D-transpeptidase family protein [Gammaproteobacteria bacterium]|nr:L,D-transpeptidase family protein [Gammaproteobacteria bacterium]